MLWAGRTPRIDTVLLDGSRWAGGADEAVTAPVAAPTAATAAPGGRSGGGTGGAGRAGMVTE